MKNISEILLYFFCVAATVCYTSCRKETAIKNDYPPIANAGRDTAIDLPDNVAYLNGGGSTDPDDNITDYQWTKISGPSTCTIRNSNLSHAKATDLEKGVYRFELTVTDAGRIVQQRYCYGDCERRPGI
jgi:hypothetical protein